MSATKLLSEKEWRNLIRDIHNGQVIPVIGPALVTVSKPNSNEKISLQEYLAPLLASRLGIELESTPKNINSVASTFLVNGGKRNDLYLELRELMDSLKFSPSEALADLASIRDFNFFISSTFDHQMELSLDKSRPEFENAKHSLAFHPSQPIDIPEPLGSTYVYHVLGDYNTYPDFAIWEEDYMEFICGLIEHQDNMQKLFRQLKKRYLLLLGSPFNDWIVRFFLRVARQERLSDRGNSSAGECLADSAANMESPMVFFFDKLVHATRIVDGDPIMFVGELTKRWRERYGEIDAADDFTSRIGSEMPKDAIFISYAYEDKDAALSIARGLYAAGIPVWLDKIRLLAGDNFETSLEAAVRIQCSFFISLISEVTESDVRRSRYFHTERDWAASRHVDGFVFYIPVAIHSKLPDKWHPTQEPSRFSKIHFNHLPGGILSPEFVRRIRSLVESFRSSGHPRG